MKLSLIGGTGFVGTHLVERLVAAGHMPRLLVRPGDKARPPWTDVCETVVGTVDDPAAAEECVAGSDATVYLIGILREYPARGITFDGLQFRGVERDDRRGRPGRRRQALLRR